ncbi:MAG: hypothetical protein GY715_01955 [Planctomycetes bacterium]|nr:hypothetical protein [Planctomycetota bacterium]
MNDSPNRAACANGMAAIVLALWLAAGIAAQEPPPAPEPTGEPVGETIDEPADDTAAEPAEDPAGEGDPDAPILTWPRVYEGDRGETVVYQPQIDGWTDFTVLTARAAIVVTPAGGGEPAYGMVALEARTRVDLAEREVLLDQLAIRDVTFPGTEEAMAAPLAGIVHGTLPQGRSLLTSLDRLLAALERGKQSVREIEVNLEPPPIHWSDDPAILVIFTGAPRFEPIAGTSLSFAVNTNWDLFRDDDDDARYYLLNGDAWLASDDPTSGSWSSAGFLPPSFMHLPEDDNWAAVREHLPPGSAGPPPRVIVSTEPAELIVTDGAPLYAPIAGTSLLAVTNSDSDLFWHVDEEAFYLLVAGRWFRAATLAGPWVAATTDLPADFASIPEDDPHARILASVPGTPDAEAAVLLAAVPRKATIQRSELTIEVVYDGEPDFRPIEGSDVLAAANTDDDVFQVGSVYYCCRDGVWFAAMTPTGHWVVWDDVPDAIYQIPPDSPKHNVTYVRVYESTPETVVVGHTSGYAGEYIAAGLVVFGLGYAISQADEVYVRFGYGPHYYAYGCGARYDYYSGRYSRAARVYGPYGGAGRGAAYNPATGTYARGAYRYGPRGGAAGYAAYNPYTRRGVARAGASGPYGSWGRSAVVSGNDWARAGHRRGVRGGVAGFETSTGAAGVTVRGRGGRRATVVRDRHGDLYVGRGGNVHRRGTDGRWQSRSGRSWVNADRASRPRAARSRSNLERQREVRARGDRRAARARSASRSRRGSAGGRRGGRGRR